jgi:tetratricopeptide (TPR) repeat protein
MSRRRFRVVVWFVLVAFSLTPAVEARGPFGGGSFGGGRMGGAIGGAGSRLGGGGGGLGNFNFGGGSRSLPSVRSSLPSVRSNLPSVRPNLPSVRSNVSNLPSIRSNAASGVRSVVPNLGRNVAGAASNLSTGRVVPNVLPRLQTGASTAAGGAASQLRSTGSAFSARHAVQAAPLLNRAATVNRPTIGNLSGGNFGNGAALTNAASFARRYAAGVGVGQFNTGAAAQRLTKAAATAVGPYRNGYAGLSNFASSYVPGTRYNALGYGGYPLARTGLAATSFVGSVLYGGGYGGYGYSPLGYGGYGPYGYGYGYGYRYPWGLWAASLAARLIFAPWGYGGYGYGYGGYGGGYGYASTSYYSSPTYVTNTTVEAPATTDPPPAAAPNDFAAQGEAAFRNADYAGAVRAWQHALVDDPKNATLVLLIGQAYFAQGKNDEAAGAVQAALASMPQDQWGVVVAHLDELYGDPAAFTSQLRALETAATTTPSPAAQFLLGYYHGYGGDPARAVTDLEQGLRSAPQDHVMQRLRDAMQAKLAAAAAPKTDI